MARCVCLIWGTWSTPQSYTKTWARRPLEAPQTRWLVSTVLYIRVWTSALLSLNWSLMFLYSNSYSCVTVSWFHCSIAGPGGRRALLRVGWNRQDQNYMATFALEAPNDAHELIVIDMRVPCTPVARLRNHRAPLNGFSWCAITQGVRFKISLLFHESIYYLTNINR